MIEDANAARQAEGTVTAPEDGKVFVAVDPAHPVGSVTITFWKDGANLMVNRNAPQMTHSQLMSRLNTIAALYSTIKPDGDDSAPDYDTRSSE